MEPESQKSSEQYVSSSHSNPFILHWANTVYVNATAYLSIVSARPCSFLYGHHTHPLMATSSRIMHHVTKLKSFQICFLNMTMSSLYYNCPPQSPDLNPIEYLWDVVEQEHCDLDVHPTNLHQLQDAILSINMGQHF